jgi:hypothetical protein
VKLKIDMLNTSMGSCLDARVRKSLRSLLLKLFSRCLVFIVYQNFRRSSVPHHETLAGFFSTSFEGECRCGKEGGDLLDSWVDLNQTQPNNGSLYEIQFESASFRLD